MGPSPKPYFETETLKSLLQKKRGGGKKTFLITLFIKKGTLIHIVSLFVRHRARQNLPLVVSRDRFSIVGVVPRLCVCATVERERGLCVYIYDERNKDWHHHPGEEDAALPNAPARKNEQHHHHRGQQHQQRMRGGPTTQSSIVWWWSSSRGRRRDGGAFAARVGAREGGNRALERRESDA